MNKFHLIAIVGIAGIGIAMYFLFSNTVQEPDIGEFMEHFEDHGIESRDGDEVVQTLDLSFEDVRGLRLDGVWNIELSQGPNEVKIWADEDFFKDLSSQIDDGILEFKIDRGFFHAFNDVTAKISFEDLEYLEVDGLASLAFNDFDVDDLRIQLEGAGSISGEDNFIENLWVDLDGLGSIDLSESRVTNANVNLEGLGSIKLDMDGGILKGKLEGAGSLEYSGNVSEESIDVDGAAHVRFLD